MDVSGVVGQGWFSGPQHDHQSNSSVKFEFGSIVSPASLRFVALHPDTGAPLLVERVIAV